MNREERQIANFYNAMGIPLDQDELKEFSNDEKKKLERLAERMHWIYGRLMTRKAPTMNKFRLEKDEFRALEWVMWELGITKGEYAKVSFGDYKQDFPESQRGIEIIHAQ